MHYSNMDMEDFEKRLENIPKPGGEVKPPVDMKLALVNAQRSATLGIWFVAVPCYFLFCVFMKYYFHVNLGLFDTMVDMMADLDKNPVMKWFSPILLVGLPLVGVALNGVAVCHFSLIPSEKILQVSIKLRWLNIVVLLLSLGLVCIFIGYVIIENIHHKTMAL